MISHAKCVCAVKSFLADCDISYADGDKLKQSPPWSTAPGFDIVATIDGQTVPLWISARKPNATNKYWITYNYCDGEKLQRIRRWREQHPDLTPLMVFVLYGQHGGKLAPEALVHRVDGIEYRFVFVPSGAYAREITPRAGRTWDKVNVASRCFEQIMHVL